MSSETDFLLDFSDFGGAVKAPSPKKSFLLNIFGKKEDKNIGTPLYTAFNTSIKKNLGFLTFITILYYIYKKLFTLFNKNTFLTDILG